MSVSLFVGKENLLEIWPRYVKRRYALRNPQPHLFYHCHHQSWLFWHLNCVGGNITVRKLSSELVALIMTLWCVMCCMLVCCHRSLLKEVAWTFRMPPVFARQVRLRWNDTKVASDGDRLHWGSVHWMTHGAHLWHLCITCMVHSQLKV